MYQKDITNQTPESVFKSSIVLKIVFGKKYSKKWMAEWKSPSVHESF